MEIWNKAHPHHAVWREWHESFLAGEPKIVQLLVGVADKVWVDSAAPDWCPECCYRIKPLPPRLVTVTYTAPMPETVAPAHGTFYFAVCGQSVHAFTWENRAENEDSLKKNSVYLRVLDAQQALKAHQQAWKAAIAQALKEGKEAFEC